MHSPLAPSQVLAHSAATLGGALFYLVFSLGFSRIFWLREERQAMSVALFATADYMAARSRFYDETTDLDDIYRSEEHTSELQSLMRISYAVFCLKKKTNDIHLNLNS